MLTGVLFANNLDYHTWAHYVWTILRKKRLNVVIIVWNAIQQIKSSNFYDCKRKYTYPIHSYVASCLSVMKIDKNCN